MKLTSLYEMGVKAVCPKCGQGPMSKTHYWYKGGWQCRSAPVTSVLAAPNVPAPSASRPASPAATSALTPAIPAQTKQQASSGVTLPPPTAQPATTATQRKHLENFLSKTIKITNFTVAPDMSVSVNGDVKVDLQAYKKIPCKFSKVTGNFSWIGGELTTMENCPDEVGGNFSVVNNSITSLMGLPKVGGDIHLQQNAITSYQGLPSEVNGDLDIYANPASDIVEFIPAKINGSLSIGSSSKWSLRGIHKKTQVQGEIDVVGELEEGGLGLMLVKGVTGITAHNSNDQSPGNPTEAFKIMDTALKAKEDVLDVQEKLIDAGFSRYAKL
jgi:hypothetical protein